MRNIANIIIVVIVLILTFEFLSFAALKCVRKNVKSRECMELMIAREKGEKYIIYAIQNGDTFQSISIKFYGTNKHWLLIYDENKNSVNEDYSPIEGREIKINTKAGADE